MDGLWNTKDWDLDHLLAYALLKVSVLLAILFALYLATTEIYIFSPFYFSPFFC
jgi:uncharacterized membrane protein YciS (DUF1049 family)